MANEPKLTKPDPLRVAYLLREAKKEIHAADQILAEAEKAASPHHRAAVELITEAKKALSQAEIARIIGKSEPWVSQLLRWAKNGYRDSPFGPQSKAARVKKTKKKDLGAPKDGQKSFADADEDAETIADEDGKADAEIADNDTDDDDHPADAAFASEDRKLLVKLLGLLGSDKDGECLNAARKVEKMRKKLGVTWGDLIIPAEMSQARAA